jgi:hypothetical protein
MRESGKHIVSHFANYMRKRIGQAKGTDR